MHESSARLTSWPSNQSFTSCSNIDVVVTESADLGSLRTPRLAILSSVCIPDGL